MAGPSWRIAARLGRRPLAWLGLAGLLAIAAVALAAPWLYPGDPLDMAGQPRLWPGADPDFPLGTDGLGRDMAAGLAYGARISLLVGFCAMLATLAIGVAIGAAAGYLGGTVDTLLMRFTEVFQTIPNFLLIVVLVLVLQPSLATIIGAIATVSWPGLARLMRAEVLSLRERDFVQSCRTVGMSDLRIVMTQILPNCLSPVLVTGSILTASAILIEAGLAFLGLGDPNVVSWGSMIGAGRPVLRTAWYICAIPGVAIILTVLSLNLLAEGLNDALNPRGRE